jgi:acetyl-CoA hydrolase
LSGWGGAPDEREEFDRGRGKKTFVREVMHLPFPVLTPQEAVATIQHGQTVGFSAFTPAGSAKVIPRAIAERAKTEHAAGRSYRIRVLTGASTGESLDGALAAANAISFLAPWQNDKTLRALINSRQVPYLDMHLSSLQQAIRYGFLGPVHWAVIEACDVTAGGGIVLTASELQTLLPTEPQGY